MIKKINIKTVLIAPLDWGLGHATRCIPLIKALIINKFEVIIAGNSTQKALLQKEFPHLIFLDLKGYEVHYSHQKWMLPFTLLKQLPRIKATIRYENKWLQKAIDHYNIQLVISDNRYGLYTSKVPCVFITHQLTIKAPSIFAERVIQRISYQYINRYQACWVPDTESNNAVAGILSHPTRLPAIPVHYMGLLSRFEKEPVSPKKYDYCIVLSGPEPQRTILEDKILHSITTVQGRFLLIRGKPADTTIVTLPGVDIRNHLSGEDMQAAFRESEYIISRSGYTTVMELLTLQKKSILIPTPGQTEQEYLAKRLMNKGWSYSIEQKHFNLKKAIEAATQFQYQQATITTFTSEKLLELIDEL